MAYKTFVCMNIAVIGNGEVAEAIARSLAMAEHNIFIGLKDETYDTFNDDMFDEFDNIKVSSIEYAADVADVIILATHASEVREASYLLDDVRKKVIIDMSGFNYNGGSPYFNTLSAVTAITYSPHVIKCYSNDYSYALSNPFHTVESSKLYMAGESRKAKELLKLFANDLGVRECVDLGGADKSLVLDEMSMSNAYALAYREQEREKVLVKVRR